MERNPSVQVCLSVQKACVRRYAISRVFDGQICVQRVSNCADGV